MYGWQVAGRLLLGLALGAAGLGLAGLADPPAAAAAPEACTATVADPAARWTAVGIPDAWPDGVVDVGLWNAEQRLSEAVLGVAEPSGRFGAVVVLGLFDDDFCTDVAVSAPGRDGRAGAIYLLRGIGNDGGLSTDAVRIAAPVGAGPTWGESLAFLHRPRALAVGAPETPLSPNSGGAVLLYPLGPGLTVGEPTVVTQASAGVPGSSEAGDRFGAVLAAGDDPSAPVSDLVVGAPSEAHGTRAAAGAVTVLVPTGTGLDLKATRFTQASAGFPGAAEAGDRFGASLARHGSYVAVGAPGESIGSAKRTGHVTLFTLDVARGRASGVRGFSQASPGVPGANEDGDQWGWAVALKRGDACASTLLGVSAPFEDVGAVVDAGSLTALSPKGKCGRSFVQGPNLVGGRPEPADHFGATLSVRRDPASDPFAEDGWLVGIPGEDLDDAFNAGYVVSLQPGRTTRTVPYPVTGVRAGLAFGSVLGTLA